VLFFIQLGRRRIRVAGVTANPTARWLEQQAGNLLIALHQQERPHSLRRE
jgi:putative transposase